MEIKTRRVGDVMVVDMVGRLDSRTAGPASTELNQIAQGGDRKVLTVKHVMEVSGFNSLLHLYDTEDNALAAFA